MIIEDARRKLYDTTFLLGRFRRRSAIQALAESPEPADTVKLAEALGKNHPNSTAILGGLDDAQSVANLKLVGDEDGLFEKTRSLRLGAVLELCERWATHPGRPSRSEQRAVVDRAVTAYRALGQRTLALGGIDGFRGAQPILRLLRVFWRQQ